MIDIHDFKALRERRARNLRRLRAAVLVAIGALLGANLIEIWRHYL